MLICALLVTPVVFVSWIDDLWLAVCLIGLAAAAHQGWSANVFSTASDTFPRQAVGSMIGIGGMAGAIGGVILQVITGVILQKTPGDYTINFIIAGSVYLLALAIVHVLVPRLQPVDLAMPIKPISVGSLVGFAFAGLVFGTFIAWVLGLVKNVGPALITYLAIGAGIGALIGIAGGILISNRLLKNEKALA